MLMLLYLCKYHRNIALPVDSIQTFIYYYVVDT